MADGLRDTGIQVIGDAPWGTHFCQFYQTKEELIEVLVPYFKVGLENNEFCMWITSKPLGVEEAKTSLKKAVPNLDDYVKKGQIQILDADQWYTKSGKFDAERVLQGWQEKENQAIKKGFAGLRLTGNTFWLQKADWRDFAEYEEHVNRVIGKHRILALCSYSLDKCGASEIIDVVQNHQFVLIKRAGEWEIIESSERKLAEEKLRQSERRYREFTDSLPQIVFETDAEGNLTFVNLHALGNYGYSREDLDKGLNVLELVIPEDRERVKKGIVRGFSGEELAGEEYTALRKDGDTFPVVAHSRPIMRGDRVAGLRGIVVDISERKRVEERFAQTNKLLETLLDHTHMMVAYLDPQFNFVKVNQAYAEADGREISFFPGKNHFELYPHPENEEIFGRVAKTGEPYFAYAKPFEYAEHPERGVTYWDWSLIPIKGTMGAVTGLVLTLVNVTERKHAEEALQKAHDELEIRVEERTQELTKANIELKEEIAERKQAEEKLRESERNYKTLVETSRDIIFTVNLKGDFLFTNRAFEEILGYNPKEIRKINGFELVHPEDSETVGKQFARLLKGESVDNMEYRYRRKDGSYISILNTASPIFDAEGNVVAAFGVARDITERKRAEQELTEYRDHLQELVEERTAELRKANEQLETEIAERKQAEEGLEWELAVNRELAKLSGALITRSSSIPDIANIVLDSAKSLTDSEHGFVSSIDTKTGDAVAHTLTQMMGKECLVSGQDKRIVFPKSSDGRYQKLWGHVLNSREAFFTNSPETHEASGGTPHGHIHLENFLAVPATVGEELLGQIALANSAGDYTDRHLEVVKRLAEPYALAIQRGRAEEALRESEERFRTSFDNANTGMCLVDPKGILVRVNQRMCEIFGYGKEELEGTSVNDITHPDDRDISPDFIRKSLAGEVEGQEFEKRYIHKQGHMVWGLVSSSLVRDSEGNPIYFISQVQDITERKLGEEELRKRTYDLNKRVKELNCLHNIGRLIETPGMSLEGIFQGTVDLIPAACEYPEITCARLVLGDRIFATSNFTETRRKLASDVTVRGDREGSLEVYYLEERPKRDEGLFLLEERNLLNTIVERLGRVIERKRAEEEIQKLNVSLEMQAAELAASNKELEAFSYSVSHDLRAPLRTADGFSRALLEDYPEKLDERGKDYLRRIRAATQRMGQLIDDLLNLSMTMRKEMRRQETNLSKVARSITSELKKSQPERQVEFVIQDGVLAHGDTRLLREVLENLLGNAWKFSSKHARARIEFGVTHKNDETVYFVRDDGAGFDMNYAEKLFVPFQRLHSVGEFSGNGVGLAVVSRIINRHGGRVWAEGEVEKGATFYFTLP